MSATKYSYKPTDAAAASTVVLLKDGNLLEIRRGGKTTWGPGEERKRWASLSAWMESLPVGASITKSGASQVPLSPEMTRVVTGLTSVGQNGKKYPLCGNLSYKSPKEHCGPRLRTYINWMKSVVAYNPQLSRIHSPQIAQAEAQLAAASDVKSYYVSQTPTRVGVRLYCKAADGALRRVWFNHRLGLFGVRDGKDVRGAATLAELGFPDDVEMYGQRRFEEDLIKL
jgi:hypothetical protein